MSGHRQYPEFEEGQRVYMQAVERLNIPVRYGTISRIETLPNGFPRIFVDFDPQTKLGENVEVHPNHLTISTQPLLKLDSEGIAAAQASHRWIMRLFGHDV